MTIMVFLGSVPVATWKNISLPISIVYFILSGISTYFKYATTESK